VSPPGEAGPEPLSGEFGEGLRRMRMALDLLQPPSEEHAAALIAPLLHPEIQVLGSPGIGPAHGYDGRDEFLKYFDDAAAHGVWIRSDATEVVIAPSGAMLITATLLISGHGLADTTPAWFVLTFRDGLIASLETHLSREMADESVAGKVS